MQILAQDKCVEFALCVCVWICTLSACTHCAQSGPMAFFRLALVVSLISAGAVASQGGRNEPREDSAAKHPSAATIGRPDKSQVMYLFQNGTAETNKVGFACAVFLRWCVRQATGRLS